jgi:tetratricopeptide (TPR) repeat protein
MAHIHLGAALEKEGDRHQAMIQYQKELRINPAYPKLHCYMANALLSEGRAEDAVRHYREVLSMVPHDASTRNNLGLALLQLGKIEEAESQFSLALKVNPGYRNALENQMVSIRIRRKIDMAAENFHRALLKFQEGRQAGFEIKEIHEEKIELAAALDHYRRALWRQPGFEPSRLDFDNISSVAAANRDYEKALIFFSKQSADPSARPEALYHSACIYARRMNTGKSLGALLDAVRSGFHDWKMIETDSDLNPIRGNSIFQQLLRNRQADPVQGQLLDNER